MPPQLKHEDLLYKYYDVQPQEFDKIYNLLKDLESNNIRDFALNSKYERLFLAEDGNIMFNNRTHSTIPLISEPNHVYVVVSKDIYSYLYGWKHSLLRKVDTISDINDDFILYTYDKYNLILMSYMDFINDNGYLNKSTSIAQRKTIKL